MNVPSLHYLLPTTPDYAEPFMGSSFTHALAAVKFGIIRDLCRMRHKRRTCARLCHQAGGELEQIQFLLGRVSIETTERYLGCKQHFQNAVNDAIGLEPGGS